MTDNKKGFWAEDQYLSFIKDDTEYEKSSKDARQFSIEIDRVRNCLFPSDRSEESVFLSIEHSDPTFKQDLDRYFVQKNRGNQIYGHSYDLQGFFGSNLQVLAIYGECYLAIDWGEVTLSGKPYILPIDFRFLPRSTMNIAHDSKGKIIGFRQKYSRLYGILNKTATKLPECNFLKNEIFYTKYPLDLDHPVKKSLHLLPKILKFWDYGLTQGESSIKQNNHRLDLERVRMTKWSDEKRKYDLTRAQVSKNFHWLINVNEVNITEYYDLFFVSRYKKEINLLRRYFIEQFNEQILIPLARKNRIKFPKLILSGVITNTEIDKHFSEYSQKKITAQEFIENTINRT